MINCFANRVNVCIERQVVIDHFPTVEYEYCRDQSLRGNPHFAVVHQCQWWWVQTCLDSMNWLEAVSQQRESSLIFQWNLQLSVISILWNTDTETGNDVDDQWHVQREQQRTQNGFLRTAELANRCLGSMATDRDKLGPVTQVWAETLQCTAGYTKFNIESRF